MSVRIINSDALSALRTLESESVQMVCTSPPYAFLRSYLPADHPDKAKEIGSEPTPDAYVADLVEVFREVRRVLRRDGVCVVNLGDSYSGSGKGPTGHNGIGDQGQRQGFVGAPKQGKALANRSVSGLQGAPSNRRFEDLPPKSLLMIPFRVAMAMQADGWILRSVMPWVKRNSMPESVQDRPATAIEYLFLFARSPRYFWDAEAIRHAGEAHSGNAGTFARPASARGVALVPGHSASHQADRTDRVPAGRSYRNSDPFFATWQGLMLDEAGDPLALVVNPQPSSLEHYASYPPSLVEPFVKAGTSQRGACGACGSPWTRVVERGYVVSRSSRGTRIGDGARDPATRTDVPSASLIRADTTTGWQPSCRCEHAGETVAQTVLDPFLGSGTTLLVASRLGRSGIGIELSPEYARMAERRIAGDCPLFTEVEVAG